MFILYKIFFLIFNYEISKYLRPYSFLLIFFDLVIQSNVEYFTFLGLRTLITSFSFNYISKFLILIGIIMMFITVLCSISSYFLYYYKYGKLGRYFLVNLFRFTSSYPLMVIMFGIRPFLKGAVHALVYDNWFIQIWTLMGIEIAIVIVIFYF